MLLTRAPLYRGRSPFSSDLHVLGAPLTFVLSQDQTLQLNLLNRRTPVGSHQPKPYVVLSLLTVAASAAIRPVIDRYAYNSVFKDRGEKLSPRAGCGLYLATPGPSTTFFRRSTPLPPIPCNHP